MVNQFPFEIEPIAIKHTGCLRKAFSKAKKRAWCYYVPFLCCYNLPPRREVFILERDQIIFLLVRRQTPKGYQTDLLIPPVPFSLPEFDCLLEDLKNVNENRLVRILWVDEEDVRMIGETQFTFRLKDREYLYDPTLVAAASGRPFRDLRKRLRRFGKYTACFREMELGDIQGCQALLRHWRRRQGRKHSFLLDWGYTKAALDCYGLWKQEDLQGWCVEANERVIAFAMGGRMQDGLAHFFIAKADPDIRGLSEYLRWEVCRSLSGYRFVNDAGDLGLSGLQQHKRKFRPVARLPVYTAQTVQEGVI